jgi:signal transduction histidine kinase
MASPRRSRLSRVDTLYLSFSGMIALMALSAIQAYRSQIIAAQYATNTEQRFVRQGALISHIRHAISFASSEAHEMLGGQQTERDAAIRPALKRLEQDSKQFLTEFEQLGGKNASPELRKRVERFWRAADSMLAWPAERRAAEGAAFFESELRPQGDAVEQKLTDAIEANQAALEASEAEFARSRSNSAGFLLLTLWLLMVLGGTIAWLSLLYTSALEREAARRLAEITLAREELQQLSDRLIEIQEDERRRLSRELHDEIGQTLTALRMELSRADAAAGGGIEGIKHARELAERTIQTVRNIALLLRPALLDDLGLAPALQWLAEDFSRRSGIHCALSEGDLDDSLPDAYKTCVYRVVQEALHNCEKHAGASSVHILVRQTAGQLTATVEDNGRGFQQAQPGASKGLGILGMRERAAIVRGTLTVDSAPGKGTRLTLVLPVADAAQATPAAAAREGGA